MRKYTRYDYIYKQYKLCRNVNRHMSIQYSSITKTILYIYIYTICLFSHVVGVLLENGGRLPGTVLFMLGTSVARYKYDSTGNDDLRTTNAVPGDDDMCCRFGRSSDSIMGVILGIPYSRRHCRRRFLPLARRFAVPSVWHPGEHPVVPQRNGRRWVPPNTNIRTHTW